jgi:phosphatidate cytidylyltransferase
MIGSGLLKRSLSVVVLLPIFLAILMIGPVWLFAATVVVIGAVGQWEFTGMFARAGIRTPREVALAAGAAVTASFALPLPGIEGIAFTAAVLVVLASALWRRPGAPLAWEPLAVSVCGICYVNWLLGFGVSLRELPFGKEWVLLLIAVTWLGETAAYLVGSTIGSHPLAPAVSPRKTIEGSIAQLAASVVAALAIQLWFFTALSSVHAAMIGFLLGIVGQVGDLVESILKRGVGTKDTGHLIPGHGGILDRIDSLLFNTPVLFYCASHGRMFTS